MNPTDTEFTVIIPARFASTRLPGKPLEMIGDKTLVLHVCDGASQSTASRVIVATDHDDINKHVTDAGYLAVMTSASCESGTDRIAETVERLGLDDDEIVVNLQGDEPFMPAAVINQVASALINAPEAAMGTACEEITDMSMYDNPDVVKVVMDKNGLALYFSRALIPHDRDGGASHPVYRHLGIYAYRAGYIKQFAQLSPCPLETTEKLEQLRALWHGARIVVTHINEATGIGIDTPEDLANARTIYEAGKP